MRIIRDLIVVVFMVACATSGTLASTMASAPRGETQRLRWKIGTIKIAISSSLTQPNFNIKTDSDVAGAIRRSLQAWQDAANIVLVAEPSDKQSVSPAGVSGDGVSLITIAQSAENVLLFSKNPLAESAKTRVFYNGKGFITEADVVLNPFQQFSTDGTYGTVDLESALTHEIGHMLGLRHSGVLGSAMSESLSKNGTFGFLDIGPRTLAASDIAAIRSLYGSADVESCCATISGKLTFAAGRSAKNLRVWAEENGSGRVIAQDDTAGDGGFVLGGMAGGTYSIFWQRLDISTPFQIGELGIVKIEAGETRTLNERVAYRRSGVSLTYVGINNQLTDSAIAVNAGREYVIYLGGRTLDARNLNIEFNSPFFTVVPNSMAEHDFGEGLSVVSLVIKVNENAANGVYSIFATGEDGLRGSLIGALNVR